MPEVSQTTGNCVVKNLLAAIKQDALWLYGNPKGQIIFKKFYLTLLSATLMKAKEYSGPFLTRPLPRLVEEVCPHIQQSQLSFVGTTCGDILGSIKNLYSDLSLSVQIPAPAPRDTHVATSSLKMPLRYAIWESENPRSPQADQCVTGFYR